MAIYKSALGKPVDMTALASRNEKVRAVGNMKVNARGDTIDGFGKVIKPVTEKVTERYSKTVGQKPANKSDPLKQKNPNQVRKVTPEKPTQTQPAQSEPVQTQPAQSDFKVDKEELTNFEIELEKELEDDIEVEEIKQKELGKKNGK